MSLTDQTAYKKFLQRYTDPEMRARILDVVQRTGINTDDPVFPLMLGTSQVQVMLETAPKDLKQTFENGNRSVLKSLKDELERYEQAARTGIEENVADSVNALVQKTQAAKAQVTWNSVAWGSAAAAAVLALGTVVGMGIERVRLGRLTIDPESPRTLTLAEAEALEWAASSDGSYARDLLAWNQDLLEQCDQQMAEFVAQTGLTLQVGSQQATSGFCLLWTEAPEDRQYADPEAD